MMRRPATARRGLLVILAVLAVPTNADAEVRSVRIADIVIDYDDEMFTVGGGFRPGEPGPDVGDPPVTIVFRCAALRNCRGDPMMSVSAVPVDSDAFMDDESPPDEFWSYDTRPLWANLTDVFEREGLPVRDFGGLAISGTITFSNCRARTPPRLVAAGVHDGVRYHFATGLPVGCGGIEGFSREEFTAILDGIRLAAAEPGDP